MSEQAPPPPAKAPTPHGGPEGPGLDAAQQSLADALGVTFGVLKVLMGILVVVYLFSGVFKVNEQNQAVKLLMGEQIGDIAEPGWHIWAPFPLGQVIQIPSNVQSVAIDKAFWYDNPEDLPPERLAGQPLDPLKDGFLITSDNSVVHIQFSVNYRITNANLYIEHVGDLERAQQIVAMAAERGMVHAVSQTEAEDIIFQRNRIGLTDSVKRHTQEVLDHLDTGITVSAILVSGEASTPVQVRQAYLQVTQARTDKATMIQNARQQANSALGASAGSAHRSLSEMISAYEALSNAGDEDIAALLRSEIDAALHELRLPGGEVEARIAAYLNAMTAPADTDTPGEAERILELQAESRDRLRDALTAAGDAPDRERTGLLIEGAAAQTIAQAVSYQTQVVTQIEEDYREFSQQLEKDHEHPAILAAELWHASRTETLGNDAMIETIMMTMNGQNRILIDPDPETRDALSRFYMEQRREAAERAEAEGR